MAYTPLLVNLTTQQTHQGKIRRFYLDYAIQPKPNNTVIIDPIDSPITFFFYGVNPNEDSE
jgi:hypothetical protein